MNKAIKKINQLLVREFGIPPRAEKLPEPIDLLIATILSQNTNDKNSYKAYQNLIKKYSAWDEVRKARRTSIEKEIRIAGLGYQKSKAIKNLLIELFEKEKSYSLDNVKESSSFQAIEYLTNFKGIGVKTASCVMLFALDRDVCPVDTHVHRTLNRIGLVKTKIPDKTFLQINKNFPPKIAHSFHTNLIRLGREICTPKNYKCGICPLVKICKFNDKLIHNNLVNSKKSFMLLDSI